MVSEDYRLSHETTPMTDADRAPRDTAGGTGPPLADKHLMADAGLGSTLIVKV